MDTLGYPLKITMLLKVVFVLICFGMATGQGPGQSKNVQFTASTQSRRTNNRVVPGYYVPVGRFSPRRESRVALIELIRGLQNDVQQLKSFKDKTEQDHASTKTNLSELKKSFQTTFDQFKGQLRKEQLIANKTLTRLDALVQTRVATSFFNGFKEQVDQDHMTASANLSELKKSLQTKLDGFEGKLKADQLTVNAGLNKLMSLALTKANTSNLNTFKDQLTKYQENTNQSLTKLTQALANKADLSLFNGLKEKIVQDHITTSASLAELRNSIQIQFQHLNNKLAADQLALNAKLAQLFNIAQSKVANSVINNFQDQLKQHQNNANQALTNLRQAVLQGRNSLGVCGKIELYDLKHHTGEKLQVDICPNQCYKLSPSISRKASSINTHGGCVLVWFNPNCQGNYIMLKPDEPDNGPFNCHLDFTYCDKINSSPIPKLDNKVEAVSIC